MQLYKVLHWHVSPFLVFNEEQGEQRKGKVWERLIIHKPQEMSGFP